MSTNICNLFLFFRVSSALNQDMSVFELKKENELLKKDLQQIDSDRNRLKEEVTTTVHQLLRTSNSSPRLNYSSTYYIKIILAYT